ncbi:hypothetical protein GEV33_010243 [Tenebrio molitor]|uniref:Uncharacterized protein n=1 Tax=Tenebrio molitor TaxID=7067 RepID=A0A8J6HE64_TENMO|nr:hypothetical protein GEV33_010243 [Tenebrio molitor]
MLERKEEKRRRRIEKYYQRNGNAKLSQRDKDTAKQERRERIKESRYNRKYERCMTEDARERKMRRENSRRDFPTGGGVNKREGPAPPPPDKSDRAAVMLIYTDSSPEPTPPSPIVHLEFNVSTMVGLHGGKVNEGRDRGSTFTGGGGEGGEFGIGILFPASCASPLSIKLPQLKKTRGTPDDKIQLTTQFTLSERSPIITLELRFSMESREVALTHRADIPDRRNFTSGPLIPPDLTPIETAWASSVHYATTIMSHWIVRRTMER